MFNIYPDWSHGITLNSKATGQEIIDTVDAKMHEYEMKKAA